MNSYYIDLTLGCETWGATAISAIRGTTELKEYLQIQGVTLIVFTSF